MENTVQTMPGVNGGTLRRGNPGNAGGGNVKSKARQAAAEGGAKAIKLLNQILASLEADFDSGVIDKKLINEVSRALEALGKYGLGEIQTVVESEAIFHAFKLSMEDIGLSKDQVKQVLVGVKERLSD